MNRRQLILATIVLGIAGATLPVRLPEGATDASIDQCLVAAGHPPATGDLDRLSQCRRADPDDPQLAIDLGDLLSAGGRSAEAEAAYQSALALSPNNAAIHLKLAEALRRRGATDEARAHAAAALGLQPNSAIAMHLIESLGSPGPQ